jgi:hypothetical protein
MTLMSLVRRNTASQTTKLTFSIDQGPKNLGAIQDTVDENGIRTIMEYTINDEGKKVKVCRVSLLLVYDWSELVFRGYSPDKAHVAKAARQPYDC